MNRPWNALGFALPSCIVVAIILSSFAWALVVRLSLPMPVVLPALSLFAPIFNLLLTFSTIYGILKGVKLPRSFPAIVRQISIMIPVCLFTLSMIYAASTAMRSCALEQRWKHLFRSKNEGAISLIERQLHCCGFNTVLDRAWPFPSKGVGADECQKTQGWDLPCKEPWTQRLVFAAVLNGLANLLTYIFTLLLANLFGIGSSAPFPILYQQNSQTRRLLDGAAEGYGTTSPRTPTRIRPQDINSRPDLGFLSEDVD